MFISESLNMKLQRPLALTPKYKQIYAAEEKKWSNIITSSSSNLKNKVSKLGFLWLLNKL